MRCLLTLFAVFVSLSGISQEIKTNKKMLSKLLKSHSELFSDVLNHPGNNEIQILYTQINRDKNNIPHFKSYSYKFNPKWYFYPASTVKLPASIFALEKINALNINGLSKKTPMFTDSSFTGQTKVKTDPTSRTGLPSIEQYIKKILLVSDNDAYNRLYEFIGREEFNIKLHKNGLKNSRIINRLAIGDAGESTRHTNPIDFYDGNKLVYHQDGKYDPKNYPLELENLIRGKGHMDANDKLVMQPYSFADKNVYTIADQQHILRKLMFPEAFAENERYNLSNDDYNLIYKYMSMYPTESNYPKYDPKEFWALHSKFLFYGADKIETPEPNIRIFNKYGDSYGYVIDNSYFVDFENKVEFLLMAVVQSNNNEIYNDSKYEYETVCYPFLKNLGKVIYNEELKRKKNYLPNLDKFKFDYTH